MKLIAYGPLGQHTPIHLFAYLDFIGNLAGFNLVNHSSVGFLGSLVHDHPQGLYLGNESFCLHSGNTYSHYNYKVQTRLPPPLLLSLSLSLVFLMLSLCCRCHVEGQHNMLSQLLLFSPLPWFFLLVPTLVSTISDIGNLEHTIQDLEKC